MIYLSDGELITKAKIVSKNDDKLVEFANIHGTVEFKNFKYAYSEYKRPGDFSYYSNGHYKQVAEGYPSYDCRSVINVLCLKKYLTLRIIAEALNNSGIKFPKVSVLCHPGIELQNFFSSPFDDLEKIETIVDNQYFYEFLEKMYSDYKGFLEIFPYIDLEVIDYYTTSEILCDSRSRDRMIFGGNGAINNRKILTKTKEIITKLER